MFLVMILLPAFIIRAMLGGKRNMPLRKPLRAAIVSALVGGIAMYLAIMFLGHRRDYWPGWGLIFYAVGVVAAAPLSGLIFGFRWNQTYRLTAIYLVCQVLTLILIASAIIPWFALVDVPTYFYIACIVVLPLTWVHRRGRPGTTS
jgi:hypothetical protein